MYFHNNNDIPFLIMTSLFNESEKQTIIDIINSNKNNHLLEMWGIENKFIKQNNSMNLSNELMDSFNKENSQNRQNKFITKQSQFNTLLTEDITYEFMLECANLNLLQNDAYNMLQHLHFKFIFENIGISNIYLFHIVIKLLEEDRNINAIPISILNNAEVASKMVTYIAEHTAFVQFGFCMNRYYTPSGWLRECLCCSYKKCEHNELNILRPSIPEKNKKFGLIFAGLKYLTFESSWEKYKSNPNKNKFESNDDIAHHITTNIGLYKQQISKYTTDPTTHINNKILFDTIYANLYKNDKCNISLLYNKQHITQFHKEFHNKICIIVSNVIYNTNMNNFLNYEEYPEWSKMKSESRQHAIDNFELKFDPNASIDYNIFYLTNHKFPKSKNKKMHFSHLCDDDSEEESEKGAILEYIKNINKNTIFAHPSEYITCINTLLQILINNDMFEHRDFYNYNKIINEKYWVSGFDNKKIPFDLIPKKYQHLVIDKLDCGNFQSISNWESINPNIVAFTDKLLQCNIRTIFKNITIFFNFIKRIDSEDVIVKFLWTFMKSDNDKYQYHGLKNYIDFDYENEQGYKLLKILIQQKILSDKKEFIFTLFYYCNDNALINEIAKSNILFDYYEYNQKTKNGCKYLAKMVEYKQYKSCIKLMKFIEESQNPSLVFITGINNGFFKRSEIDEDYLINDTQQNINPNECIVCLNDIITKMSLVPCGHTNICGSCFDKISHKKCPTCRKEILMQIRLF